MKFLIIGLGSMGKRRVRNLQELKINEIIGFDVSEDRRKQAAELYSIQVVDNFESGLNMKPDAMIISAPPDKHLEYAIHAAKKKIPFFTEVNTVTPDEIQVLIDLLKQNKVIGIPSTTLMFHPSVIKMKELLQNDKIGKKLLFNLHSGSYLPDWHPWEKLEDYYAYRKNTGGGRDEIAWELSWVLWLMGKPKSITGITRKLGSYKAEIYDVYDITIEFENNSIGHVLVDLIQRPIGRICEIIGELGTIRWDWENHTVKLFSSSMKKWEEFNEEEYYKGYKLETPKPGFAISTDIGLTESYIEEMKNFIDIINGNKEPAYTFEDEKLHLRLMYAAEESSEKRTQLKIE